MVELMDYVKSNRIQKSEESRKSILEFIHNAPADYEIHYKKFKKGLNAAEQNYLSEDKRQFVLIEGIKDKNQFKKEYR